MKQSSKIALAAGASIIALAALFRKNKSISGIRELSPYVISWAILEPTDGIATKHDENILHRYGFSRLVNKIAFGAHFPNKAKAEKIIKDVIMDGDNGIRPRLDKSYNIYVITDKQFGMIQYPYNRKANFNDIYSVMTSKQKNEYKEAIYGVLS